MLRYHLDRLWTNVKSEGISKAFVSVLRELGWNLGLLCSETLIYRKTLDIHDIGSDREIPASNIAISIIRSEEDFSQFSKVTPKIFLLPLKLWFQRGSLCLAISQNEHLFAYAWIHFKCYDRIKGIVEFRLSKGEAYIGPFYVDSRYRRRGYYKLLVDLVLRFLFDNQRDMITVYTASSVRNLATIKVMVANGLQVVALIRSYKNKSILAEFTQKGPIQRKLKHG